MAAKPTLYLETSVVSYYAARTSNSLLVSAHQHTTQKWWDTCKDAYDVFISELVLREAARGDSEAAEKRLAAVAEFTILRITQPALDLAGVYIQELPIPDSADADALHLAMATYHKMDYLITWNCKHIARGSIMKALPTVNRRLGFETPTICTPEELVYENPRNLD